MAADSRGRLSHLASGSSFDLKSMQHVIPSASGKPALLFHLHYAKHLGRQLPIELHFGLARDDALTYTLYKKYPVVVFSGPFTFMRYSKYY